MIKQSNKSINVLYILFILLVHAINNTYGADSIIFNLVDDSLYVQSDNDFSLAGEVVSIQKRQVIGRFSGLGKVKFKRDNFKEFKFESSKDYWYREDFGKGYTFLGNHTALGMGKYPIRISLDFPATLFLDVAIHKRVILYSHLNNSFEELYFELNGLELGMKTIVFGNYLTALSLFVSGELPLSYFSKTVEICGGISNSLILKERFHIHSSVRYLGLVPEDKNEWKYNYALIGIISTEFQMSSRSKILFEYNRNIIDSYKKNKYYRSSYSHDTRIGAGVRFIFNGCILNLGSVISKSYNGNSYEWIPIPHGGISIFLGSDSKGDQR